MPTYYAGKRGSPKWIGWFFALIGLVQVGVAARMAQDRVTILDKWPTAEAEVLRSEVTTSRSSNSNSTTYGVEVDFRYTVNGREYRSPSSLGYTTSSYKSMRATAESFAPGSHHTIRYNPTAPYDVRFNAAYTFEFFMFPVFLGGMGLVFSLVGFTVARKAGASASGERLCPSCSQPVPEGQHFCGSCGAPMPGQ